MKIISETLIDVKYISINHKIKQILISSNSQVSVYISQAAFRKWEQSAEPQYSGDPSGTVSQRPRTMSLHHVGIPLSMTS